MYRNLYSESNYCFNNTPFIHLTDTLIGCVFLRMNKVPKMYLIGFALLVFLVGLLIAPVECDSVEQKSLSDYCLDGKHHKFSPGPESSLYNLVRASNVNTRPTASKITVIYRIYRLFFSFTYSVVLGKIDRVALVIQLKGYTI